MKEVLARLRSGEALDAEAMEQAVGALMDGEASAAQIGSFLTALTIKGETVDELVAAARAMRSRAVALEADGPLLDTCGTGGDGLGTFNVSTAASFVAAAGGARVAKHGNRAASGSVGAADVLEALGARIDLSPAAAAAVLERTGVTFLFAQLYHPAVKHVAGARRELGFRTLFNLTGPLCNPAGATRQVLGIFAAEWLDGMAEALLRLGAEHALVVHGADGADEMLPTGSTRVVEVRAGAIERYQVHPSDFGIPVCSIEDLRGGDGARNASIVRSVLVGEKGPAADAVAMNAGAGLFVAGRAASLADGVASAREILASGKAHETLEAFISSTSAGGGRG